LFPEGDIIDLTQVYGVQIDQDFTLPCLFEKHLDTGCKRLIFKKADKGKAVEHEAI